MEFRRDYFSVGSTIKKGREGESSFFKGEGITGRQGEEAKRRSPPVSSRLVTGKGHSRGSSGGKGREIRALREAKERVWKRGGRKNRGPPRGSANRPGRKKENTGL